MPVPSFGPTIEGIIYAAPEIIRAVAGYNVTTGASKSANYDANRLSNVRTNEGVQDLGAVVDTYDPEWNAWLNGEI